MLPIAPNGGATVIEQLVLKPDALHGFVALAVSVNVPAEFHWMFANELFVPDGVIIPPAAGDSTQE